MKRVKLILFGAVAMFAGSAMAEPVISMEDTSATASAVYEVDEDRDGRTDRLLILEQSDSLA